MIVAGAALSTITFLSASAGFGVWARSARCGASLVVTVNGGATWRVAGSPIPASRNAFGPFQQPEIVFTTQGVGWINGSGLLLATRDEGTHWSVLHLGPSVLGIDRFGSSLWAYVSSCNAGSRCRVRLEATTAQTMSWHTVGLLPTAIESRGVVAARLTDEDALVAQGQVGVTQAYLTNNGGHTWSSVDPCGQSRMSPEALTPTPSGDVFVVCSGGAAMGNEPKSLYRSTDGGRAWDLVATDPHLGPPYVPTPLPLGDFGDLAAPTTTELWMTTVNGVSETRDGGAHWSSAKQVVTEGNGEFVTFSFVGPTRGWLLVPGVGLWTTTNGRSWEQHSQTLAATTSPIQTAACRDLSIGPGPQVSPSTGEIAAMVTLTNHGRRPCKVFGYPTVSLWAAGERVLPFAYEHKPSGPFNMTTASPRVVVLSAGAGPMSWWLRRPATSGTRSPLRFFAWLCPGSASSSA